MKNYRKRKSPVRLLKNKVRELKDRKKGNVIYGEYARPQVAL